MKVLTVATEYNKYVKEWEKSAKKFGYDYKIIGINTEWNGFNTLMKLILDELDNYNDNYIIVIVDCYDLLFVDSPDKLYNKYKKLNIEHNTENKVIVGAEQQCILNCDNLFIKKCNYENKQYYINSGFIMGPVKLLREGYIYSLKYGNQDDQIGWAKYYSENCNNVIIDYNSELVLNYYKKSFLNPHLYKYDLPIITITNKIYNNTHNTYPIVIHMPYQASDMGYRSEQIRNFLFSDRTKLSKIDYFKDFLIHIKKCIKYPVYKEFIIKICILIFICIYIVTLAYFKYTIK